MLKMIVTGNLGKDATLNVVNGKNVINMTVAHTQKFKDAQGNLQEKTTWIDASYWTDKTAVQPYLTKGKKVLLEGEPGVRGYAKSDGTQGVAMTLRVSSCELLSTGDANAQQQPAAQPQAAANPYAQPAAQPAQPQAMPAAQVATPAAAQTMDDLPF